MSPFPVRRAITKAWFGHEGTYYRENIEPTGAERDCGRTGKPPKTEPGENKGEGYYHSYYFTCGLETVAMMIDYVKYSGDDEFRDNVLVPFAREVLLFFDKHYPRDADGKLRIDPGMVLETWWIAVNAAPDVSGLLHCLDELLDKVWGYEVFPSTRTIDNFIVRLRKRFERNPEAPEHFHTVRGVGYRMSEKG